ncbi:hypothetical protein MSIMFI_03358 [Mycobacterium simulans]|uniref:hypothetical protein n=1 Tax=Mycobacterium simulans TaxID=627089 RepID=UPI0019B32B78|nr:hypothetical protein [Mycobacterium simulans]SON61839.1 hypothetical protein MSIMFI_03358 [Mycobacterium simulans]
MRPRSAPTWLVARGRTLTNAAAQTPGPDADCRNGRRVQGLLTMVLGVLGTHKLARTLTKAAGDWR